MDGQFWPLAAAGVSGFRSSGSIEPHFHDLAATTTSARSASPGRRTTTSADHYHRYHSRRSGPASLPTGGDAGHGWIDAGFSDTSRSPRPTHGQTGSHHRRRAEARTSEGASVPICRDGVGTARAPAVAPAARNEFFLIEKSPRTSPEWPFSTSCRNKRIVY